MTPRALASRARAARLCGLRFPSLPCAPVSASSLGSAGGRTGFAPTVTLNMPLRACISVGRAKAYRPNASTDLKETIKPLPTDDREDVVFDSIYGLRTIELNRPTKHNALNASMIRKIVPRLVEWERSDMANVVVIKGAEGKAFCAGGDVVALAEANVGSNDGWKKSTAYFELEYRLNHYIATYGKPYIAFMDGITMGGGVGLSIHAPFRVATERTVFAMPETKIGFFPDVGASFFLPRLNGALGKYLALTSESVTGVDVFYSGIATHYIHSVTLPLLEGRLAELKFHDYDDMHTRLRLINETLEEYATGLPPKQPMTLAGDRRKAIDRCFSRKTVPEIVNELRRVAKEAEVPIEELPPVLQYVASQGEWAIKTAKTMLERSPTSLLISAKLMEEGKRLSISQTFRKEYQIASRFMQQPDFAEGVMKLLGPGRHMDPPPKPKWDPPSLAQVPSVENLISWYFGHRYGEELQLFNTHGDYFQYPYQEVALPSEPWLRGLIREDAKNIKSVVQVESQVVKRRGAKQGVRQVVREIVERCVEFDPKKGAVWTGGNIDTILGDIDLDPEPVYTAENQELTPSTPGEEHSQVHKSEEEHAQHPKLKDEGSLDLKSEEEHYEHLKSEEEHSQGPKSEEEHPQNPKREEEDYPQDQKSKEEDSQDLKSKEQDSQDLKSKEQNSQDPKSEEAMPDQTFPDRPNSPPRES